MGTINHDAVLATTQNQSGAKELMEFCESNEIPFIASPPAMNSSVTICVYPDGSKEGWGDSDIGDARRKAFIEKTKSMSSFDVVEVSFGEYGTKVKYTNCFDSFD